jgi:type II secretory pathway component HofQ
MPQVTDKLYHIMLYTPERDLNGFFPGTPVSSTNKTDRHDITEILLKVTLSTIKPQNQKIYFKIVFFFDKII